MDQNVKDYVIEKTNELIAAFSVSYTHLKDLDLHHTV